MTDHRIYTNTERFIYEVSTRSCLWDVHCIEYKDKNKRKKAWEEICEAFFTDYKSKSSDKKEHLCRLIQRKWKSIRDNYVRNFRTNRSTKYGHASSLSFLRKSIKLSKPPDPKIEEISDDNAYVEIEEGNIEMEECDEEELIFKNRTILFSHDTNQSQCSSSNSNNSMHLEIHTIDEAKMPPTPEKITCIRKSTAREEDDDDRLFLLSLLNDLKKIPDYNKLEAKSELLLVLNKWKQSNVEIWYPKAP